MLILPIKKKWYDMILAGEKKEEYRDIKPYYKSRLENLFPFVGDEQYREKICFRNGYSNSSPSFIAECSLRIGTGRTEWGAEQERQYYVLKIHEIIAMDNV